MQYMLNNSVAADETSRQPLSEMDIAVFCGEGTCLHFLSQGYKALLCDAAMIAVGKPMSSRRLCVNFCSDGLLQHSSPCGHSSVTRSSRAPEAV